MQKLSFIDVSGLNNYDAATEKANHPAPYPTQDEVEEAGRKLAETLLRVIMDTALEDHASVIVEGMIGGLHSAAIRLEKEGDKARASMKDLLRGWTGNEIEDESLTEATETSYRADAAQIITETLRDCAAELYTHATGEVWTPWTGSQKNSARPSFAQIEARAALKAREDEKRQLCAPGDAVVVFRGAMKANTQTDATRIFDALNYARETFPNMKLATTGNHGAEQLAIKWAKQKGVQHILSAADFNKHNKAAPFRANDDLLNLDPVVIFTLAASLETKEGEDVKPFGPCLDIADRGAKNGVKCIRIKEKTPAKAAA
jgi:hypothetical protein